jgi:hypothetical protein
MNCKGRPTTTCLENPECLLTLGKKRKSYCRRRVGKRTCRGKRLDECENDRCIVTQGPNRFYCRKRYSKRV